jgi:hypothetical protein
VVARTLVVLFAADSVAGVADDGTGITATRASIGTPASGAAFATLAAGARAAVTVRATVTVRTTITACGAAANALAAATGLRAGGAALRGCPATAAATATAFAAFAAGGAGFRERVIGFGAVAVATTGGEEEQGCGRNCEKPIDGCHLALCAGSPAARTMKQRFGSRFNGSTHDRVRRKRE